MRSRRLFLIPWPSFLGCWASLLCLGNGNLWCWVSGTFLRLILQLVRDSVSFGEIGYYARHLQCKYKFQIFLTLPNLLCNVLLHPCDNYYLISFPFFIHFLQNFEKIIPSNFQEIAIRREEETRANKEMSRNWRNNQSWNRAISISRCYSAVVVDNDILVIRNAASACSPSISSGYAAGNIKLKPRKVLRE